MNKKYLIPGLSAIGVIAGIATGGAINGLVANAATNTDTTTNSSNTTATNPPQDQPAPSGPHQANGKTEVALTGDDLAKATAAAQAKVPDATVERAETDVDGDGTYEVHMKKSDGSMITVFLDSNFTVTSTTNGMSAKNPGPQGGQNDQRQTTSSTTTTN